MALPAAFLDELRARTPLAAVIGRRVRLARSGRQWKGCCPFHGEKTPSFYVYEDGHYHCFGCGAHGDAIGFVMQSEGAGFMEAVERLAAEAGLEVPKPSPEAAEAERRRLDLAAVLEAAQASYQRRLFLPEGRHALDYLHGRGLSEQTIRRFGLGWSGEGRGALAADLGRDGVTPDQLVDAGLMRRDDETGRAFDLFFNRVMFPIRDRRGRVISFGGRILGDGQPKYVNGPETALFSKRRTLYALDLAREAVRGGAPLVVVEGYMDVIALAQAGIGGAVAPLGTALTEEQLEELWRLVAGADPVLRRRRRRRRAAARAAELALPLLAPDRTLRLARCPPARIRTRWSAARAPTACAPCWTPPRRWPMRCTICCARPAARRRRSSARPSGRGSRRPPRRIPDRALASEYRRGAARPVLRRRAGRTGPAARPARRGPLPRPQPRRPMPSTVERCRILTAILLRHPILLRDVEHAYVGLDLPPAARGVARRAHRVGGNRRNP